MNNQQIARVLAEIADVLEIREENPFKIRAYQRAAQTIRSLPEELSSLRQRGPLTAIAGIGKSIAEKIEELLDTGESRFHRELLAEFPPSLVELLRIPELGPKTVALLHRELEIDSVEELERAARAGRLRDLRGMGQKTEENILHGIERMRQHAKRMPLSAADPHAEHLIALLRERAPVDRIEFAGSLRRMCEDIGDIDILVTSDDPEAVMQAFLSLPDVIEVVGTGATKSSVITDLGVQVDLRVLEPDDFGAAWQYFTGSKQHNIHLRELAVKRGIKISEYGVFEAKTDRRLAGRTEEEVYAALEMPCPPPEIREDTGEIELMLKGVLPPLIKEADLRGDLQMHTRASDGRDTIEGMAEAARAFGYEYIGITDHSKSRAIAKGLHEEDLLKQVETIRSLNRRVEGITVLAGIECDIKRDGDLDYDDDILAQLDYVIAAVHSGFKMEEQAMTQRIVTALANPYVDIFGHPTGRIIGERDPYALDIEALMQAALEHGVALEINAFPDRLDLKDVHARRARELGIPLAINTDAHAPEHLPLIRYGIATARRAWASRDDVLNTRPLPELLKSLRRNRRSTSAAVGKGRAKRR